MILPGCSIIASKIIRNAVSAGIQSQPCGVDLTLKRVLTCTSPGVVDFDNSKRKAASTEEIPFTVERQKQSSSSVSSAASPSLPPSPLPLALSSDLPIKTEESAFIDLAPNSYLVEFNETVDMPLDFMGQVFVRSSLFRSGALISAGVMDSGYKGAMGAMLRVDNPFGLRLYQNARLAQIVYYQMMEPVEGYSGMYQASQSMSKPAESPLRKE